MNLVVPGIGLMKTFQMDFNTNLVMQAAPVILVLSFGELLLMQQERRQQETKRNIRNSVIIGFVFILLTIPLKTIPFIIFTWIYQYRLFSFSQTTLATILVGMILNDLSSYFVHRLQHLSRFFWASHLVHHSSETYSYLSAVRESWVGFYTGAFLIWGWMPLVGFSPELLFWLKSIGTLYQYVLHTESIKKLPAWYEAIFNTPSHHRVHHSSEAQNLDMNCGAMLIIWDRLFGTFRAEEPGVKHVYGLTKKIEDPTPAKINFSEFTQIWQDVKKAKSRRDKWMYIFGPPGWGDKAKRH
jgi:sterol desaturase/sphingolipid hydroxylase (fatty acid hydroxylase superfamily)